MCCFWVRCGHVESRDPQHSAGRDDLQPGTDRGAQLSSVHVQGKTPASALKKVLQDGCENALGGEERGRKEGAEGRGAGRGVRAKIMTMLQHSVCVLRTVLSEC